MQLSLSLIFATAAGVSLASLSYSFAELARAWPIIRRAYLLASVED